MGAARLHCAVVPLSPSSWRLDGWASLVLPEACVGSVRVATWRTWCGSRSDSPFCSPLPFRTSLWSGHSPGAHETLQWQSFILLQRNETRASSVVPFIPLSHHGGFAIVVPLSSLPHKIKNVCIFKELIATAASGLSNCRYRLPFLAVGRQRHVRSMPADSVVRLRS